MPTTDGPTRPGFWRCLKCGTPNPATLYLSTCIACGSPRPAPGFEPGPTRTEADEPPRSADRARSNRLPIAVAAYGLVLMAVLLLERGIGDARWPGFAIAMGPRAAFLLPLVPLAVWCWRARRPRVGVALAAEALLVLGPLMGFVVPWGRLAGGGEGGPSVRIMTFNRGGGPVDAADFMQYIERKKIDVVCFQESGKDATLDQVLAEIGWHIDKGRAIASRFPIVEELPRSTERNDTDRRYTGVLFRARLRGPGGREFVVGSLHMPTPRHAFLRLLRLDPSWMTEHLTWWNGEIIRMFDLLAELKDVPILVGGDFNNGPESTGLALVRESGPYASAFDEAGWGWGYTRASSFPFVRIDHVLANPSWTVLSSWAGPSFGSDHRCLVAEVALAPRP